MDLTTTVPSAQQIQTSESDPAERKSLAEQSQSEFHDNVQYVIAGQLSPRAYRSDLHGVIPFAFPVFRNVERK
jgi:peptide/nickel transport system substrate-binding protein